MHIAGPVLGAGGGPGSGGGEKVKVMGAGGGENRFGMLSVGDGGATAGGGVVGKKLPNPNCA